MSLLINPLQLINTFGRTGLLYFFLICCILLFIKLTLPQLVNNRRLTKWRRAVNLQNHYQVYHSIYATVNGFALSKNNRMINDAPEYVYGEIEFEPFLALLSLCRLSADSIFYDLGSGTGKAVLACAMVYPVKKSCGIEILPNLHQCAVQQQQKLRAIPGYAAKAATIDFMQQDFLQANIVDATHVFINATAYFGETWEKINCLLNQVKAGTVVITSSKQLTAASKFTLKKSTIAAMSWGVVAVYIHVANFD